MNGIRSVALILALSVLATACGSVTHEQMGASLGAALGAAGGVFGARALGGGRTGQIVGGVTGAAIGGVVGYQIARMLDEKDKPRHAAAAERALETGEGQSWKNPETGTSGKVEVVANVSGPAPASAPSSQTPGSGAPPTQAAPAATASSSPGVAAVGQCKTLRQTITLKDGTTREEEVKACKGANGWETVG
jgi:surface antigen